MKFFRNKLKKIYIYIFLCLFCLIFSSTNFYNKKVHKRKTVSFKRFSDDDSGSIKKFYDDNNNDDEYISKINIEILDEKTKKEYILEGIIDDFEMSSFPKDIDDLNCAPLIISKINFLKGDIDSLPILIKDEKKIFLSFKNIYLDGWYLSPNNEFINNQRNLMTENFNLDYDDFNDLKTFQLKYSFPFIDPIYHYKILLHLKDKNRNKFNLYRELFANSPVEFLLSFGNMYRLLVSSFYNLLNKDKKINKISNILKNEEKIVEFENKKIDILSSSLKDYIAIIEMNMGKCDKKLLNELVNHEKDYLTLETRDWNDQGFEFAFIDHNEKYYFTQKYKFYENINYFPDLKSEDLKYYIEVEYMKKFENCDSDLNFTNIKKLHSEFKNYLKTIKKFYVSNSKIQKNKSSLDNFEKYELVVKNILKEMTKLYFKGDPLSKRLEQFSNDIFSNINGIIDFILKIRKQFKELVLKHYESKILKLKDILDKSTN